MQTCKLCNKHKKNCLFNINRQSPNGLDSRCKACRADQTRQRRYGISPEEYTSLYEKQWGVCAICSLGSDQPSGALDVDHCHDTKQIRGLLCRCCNMAIGKLGDNVEGLTKALEYLIIAEAQKPS